MLEIEELTTEEFLMASHNLVERDIRSQLFYVGDEANEDLFKDAAGLELDPTNTELQAKLKATEVLKGKVEEIQAIWNSADKMAARLIVEQGRNTEEFVTFKNEILEEIEHKREQKAKPEYERARKELNRAEVELFKAERGFE